MKKTILLTTLAFISLVAYSQTATKVVIFTSDNCSTTMIRLDDDDDSEEERLENREEGLEEYVTFFLAGGIDFNYSLMFEYSRYCDRPNRAEKLTVPLSNLSTMEYDDLDEMGELTKAQVDSLYHNYEQYDHLLFIDRNDMTDTTMTIYEVFPISKSRAKY